MVSRQTVFCLLQVLILLSDMAVPLLSTPVQSEAIVHAGDARFRVQALSDTLLRIERMNPLGQWEDRLTFLVRSRAWIGVPLTRRDRSSNVSVLSTKLYSITFRWGGACHNCDGGVDIEVAPLQASAYGAWKCGANLTEVPAAPRLPPPSALPPVWAFRDAPRMVPPEDGPTPSTHAHGPLENTSGFDIKSAAPDAYFFLVQAAGYNRFREDVLKLTGPIPALPNYAFGAWFLWNHNYTQSEKIQEVEEFFARGFPLDVSGIDYDWRKHPCYWKPLSYCSSNTHDDEVRYEINNYLLPNVSMLTAWLHSRNISVFFNDHPMKLGPTYDEMTPNEIEFRWHGLTSMLAQGIDFWWFDCHWSSVLSGVNCSGKAANPDMGDGFSCVHDGAGIDFVAWEKYVQFEVTARFNREHRSSSVRTMQLGCSNSNHLADHRYPIWWTGDNNDRQLGQALKDMVEGGLQLRPYVHPDCGGHSGPMKYSGEVYARWVQLCSLGTILRLHSNPRKGRQPWLYGDRAENISRAFMRLRLALMPMLVAAGQKATEDGTPVVRRLDLEFPQYSEAAASDQYLLGDDLLVAPVDPWADGATAPDFNRQRNVWIPPGDWEDAWTGAPVRGPAKLHIMSPMEHLPLYHRRPGLLFCADPGARNVNSQDWNRLFIEAFPGSQGFHAERSFFDTRMLLVDDQNLNPPQVKVSVATHEDGLITVRVACDSNSSTPCFREWVVRIHLRSGQHALQVHKLTADVGGVWDEEALPLYSDSPHEHAMGARILLPSPFNSSTRMANSVHGVLGSQPPPLAGEIVEISLPPTRHSVREVRIVTSSLEFSTVV